jgi:amino acid adenylation domain-containing protein/non-ribosomal peptide synthase protein (TIGR01720 family)
MMDRKVLACDLDPFAGRDTNSTDINEQVIGWLSPVPSAVTLEAAWSVTLRLYTGLDHVSFGSFARDGTVDTRICHFEADDTVEDVRAQVQLGNYSDDTVCQFNTAVIYKLDENDDIGGNNLSELIPRGIDVVLMNTGSNLCIMARASFMDVGETKNLSQSFRHVLNCFQEPNQAVRGITLSDNDVNQILRWNRSELTRTESLIHDQFARILQRQPDNSAIESWDGNMTYWELDAASSSLAESLSRARIRPGSWVLFCFEKSRWAIVSMLAILKAGGACVPLDPRHPKTRIAQILQATGAQHIIVGDADNDIKVRLSTDFPSVDVIGVPHHEVVCESLDIDTASLNPDSPAIGLFTSGSTGTPKGIVATHATICTGASSYARYIGADDKTRILQFASYTFDVCMVDVFTALLHGGTLCIPSEEERMTGLQQHISHTQANWAALTPTVARVLDPKLSARYIRKLLLVGEMVRESDIAEWLDSGVQVYNVYGPAENNLITTAAKAIKGRASNVGTGVNTLTWVADVENERLVPIGAVGELICAGPHLTPGYINDPQRTASSFFEDPSWIPDSSEKSPFSRRFYRSGDLVRYCADGSLQCVGRLDSQVKLGGQRVELSDIESHIKSHNAAVLVPKAGFLKNKLTAVLEEAGSSGQSLTISPCDHGVAHQVEQVLRDNLPSYMCPSIWISIKHLPLSSSGKLDRKVLMNKLVALSHDEYLGLLLDHAQAEEDAQNGYEEDNCQMILREACSQVLNIPFGRIAMSKAFAAHGGDSITAMQVSSLIKRTQTLVVSVKDLLTYPSLAEAASSMREAVTSIQVPTAHPGELYPLSPIQRLFMATAPTSVTRNHYNQSVLLRLRERRSSGHVKESLSRVVRRHAMLRGRFQRVSSSEWMQRILPDDQENLLFEHFPNASDYKQREALMLRARESLDIESGPLLRAQLFDGQDEQGMLLFIVSHHLVVDLVSWRVILEELEASLTQQYGDSTDANGISPLVSPQESVPFPVWSELQHEAAKNMSPDQVIPQQYAVAAPDFSYWGISSARNVYRDVVEKSISLGDMTTKNVLYECHGALQTEPVDIFLSAILLSFKRAFPERPVPPVFNEGHGRESWASDLDISRTVGWFTTMFPVYVPTINAGDVVDTVRRVKDFRKGCAENGFQYFSTKYLHEQGRKTFKDHIPAEIMFNYEGRYQSLEKEDSLLMAEAWEAGEALSDSAPELQRFCLFELSAAVLTDGEIHFTMAWNSRARYQQRISLWLTRLLPAVIDEIVTYLMLEKRQYTLSDLSQARLTDYSDLETLTASVLTIPGIDSIEDVDDIYCGSPMQDSLALSQSRISGGVYEIDFTWEVTDGRQENYQVDANRLAQAWRVVVARHAALRTVFIEAASSSNDVMLHQVVLRKYHPSIVLMRTRDSSQALKQLSSCPSYKKRGVLIDKIPPHALAICSTDEGRTFVRFQVNHILFDGTSVAPLLRDLSSAYGNNHEVRREGTWNPVANFIRYIRDEKRRSDDLAYWKSYLATARPCRLPTLKDEESIEGPGAGQQRGSVQVDVSAEPLSLKDFLADMGVTVPTLVQLVWALVLRMYISDSQVVFGYLASGRDAPVIDIEQAVGPFISILVHFLDFDDEGQLPVADVLRRIQDRSAHSISHQSTSLAEIQDAIGLAGSSLLFNTGISFMPKWTKEMQLRSGSSLVFHQITAHDPTEFDISLIVETGDDVADGMHIYIDYQLSTVGRVHAMNIAASFDHILSQITQDPSVPLGQVMGISTRDFDQISNWNRVLTLPEDKCLHELFIERVIENPTREAVFSWDGSMSYGELHDLSTRVANYLVQLGVGPEKKIPICLEKSVWTVVTILAVLKAGGCFVLFDPAHPTSRLWNIVSEIEASILLCSPLTNSSKKLDASPDMNARKVAIIEIHPSFVKNLESVSGLSHRSLLCPSLSPDNAAYVVFTSGTTGTPKGVVVTHRAVVTGLDELGRAAGMTAMGSETRTLQFASYSFDASIADIFCALQLGGCVCVMSDESRSPADITDFIQLSRATYAGITPSFASLLDPRSVPSLRVLCLSGEAMPASQIEAWSGYVKMVNMYGPTEASIACIANSEVTRTTDPSNIGRAFRGSTWIVDESDYNQLRAIGSSGELLIEGPILAREYLKRPEQTAAAFITNPPWLQDIRPNSRLYKTGDIVRYNTNGTISYIGRKDNQIKINGQRVEVSEIEETLRACLEPEAGSITVELLDRKPLGEADVLTAFVYIARHDPGPAQEDKAGSKKPFAILDNPLLLESFQSMLPRLDSFSSKLPRYMVPQAFIPIDSLPLTTSGKVDRRALRNAAAALSRDQIFSFTSSLDTAHEKCVDMVKDDTAGELAHLWESVLAVRVSGGQSNFFRLGGNSMAAMNLRSQARQAGFQLSVADILANPTLSDMAKLMVPLSLTAQESTPSSPPQSSSTFRSRTTIESEPDTSPFSLLCTRRISLNEQLWQQIFDNVDISWSEVEDVFPCTAMQEGLMVLSAHSKRHGAYALQ